ILFVDKGIDRLVFETIVDMERFILEKARAKLLWLSLNYHERENTGEKITKIQRGTDRLLDLFFTVAYDLIPTIFQVLMTLVIILWVNWKIGLIFFAAVPLFLILTYRMNLLLNPWREKVHDYYEEEAAKLTESIINIRSVQSFVQEKREQREYSLIAEKIQHDQKMRNKIFRHWNLVRNIVINLGRLAVLFFGIYLVSQGKLTPGTLVMAVTLTEKSYIGLFRLSRLYDRIQDSSTSVVRLQEVLQQPVEIQNSPHAFEVGKLKGEVEFRGVSYAYGADSQEVLKEINFVVPAGKTLALVGPSGSGKTTIVKLLYRFADIQTGQILIDGRDLKKYDLFSYRRNLAIVLQDSEIFNASIGDNIAYGNPEASQQEIVKAARIANAEEFILKLPEKYRTVVGERGVKLSGGQKQRVGIARAVLIDPRILILDEATSSLDSESEKHIQEAMRLVSQKRTTIIIAHRLSTVRRADLIVVLDQGKVVEMGDHQSLLRKNGLYHRLYSLQMQGELFDFKAIKRTAKVPS
ncbi:ABC transporter ATP-binding protein, partial [Candidatus Peregrinibacteria bacterium CG08_land_8_20_14_0_20_41_10]